MFLLYSLSNTSICAVYKSKDQAALFRSKQLKINFDIDATHCVIRIVDS